MFHKTTKHFISSLKIDVLVCEKTKFNWLKINVKYYHQKKILNLKIKNVIMETNKQQT